MKTPTTQIEVTAIRPSKPGHYIAHFTTGAELIKIVLNDGDLVNASGPRTHFSRWLCKWSGPIEFKW